METELLHDYFGNFSIQGEKYYFCVGERTWWDWTHMRWNKHQKTWKLKKTLTFPFWVEVTFGDNIWWDGMGAVGPEGVEVVGWWGQEGRRARCQGWWRQKGYKHSKNCANYIFLTEWSAYWNDNWTHWHGWMFFAQAWRQLSQFVDYIFYTAHWYLMIQVT